jgi:PhnB protein
MHAMINVGSSSMMFSDTFPGMPFTVGNNITLTYQGSSEEELRTIFNKLADGGKIGMELQETFWSKCYGQVTDKFDIIWQLNLPPQQ